MKLLREKFLNNRELLIKILIRLRGNGITNERLLNVVEQMPPHYFISILRKYKPLEQVSLDEVVNIVKIFQFLLKDLKKISNFFISGINSGWSVYIAAKLSKRVYCLLNNHLDKKRLEEFFKERKIDNVFFKSGNNFEQWIPVAPFDVIIVTSPVKKISHKLKENISNNGLLMIPLLGNNKTEFVKVNTFEQLQVLDINYKLLNSSIL
tara:strand:+ start:121 stop:744 length:624 start_codon:yes stop_codon:yes gene_type:complete